MYQHTVFILPGPLLEPMVVSLDFYDLEYYIHHYILSVVLKGATAAGNARLKFASPPARWYSRFSTNATSTSPHSPSFTGPTGGSL